ncbi:hypothetical protein NC652_029160 [Populus alba x Populus x berolinensis]|nr:hypothetical protein NC652_029160 [Populus alba x Populus x berolinensis]
MDNMEYNGVEPNEVTYGVMIEAYCKEKKSGEARNLIDDMLDKKFLPSSTLCCKELRMEGDVDKVVSMAMASREVDADSWDLILHKNVGDLDCGTGALDRLLMESAT